MTSFFDLEDLNVHPLLMSTSSFTVCQTAFHITEDTSVYTALYNARSPPDSYRSY